MIDVTNINFKYNIENLYNNLSIRILKGEHIVLIGPMVVEIYLLKLVKRVNS